MKYFFSLMLAAFVVGFSGCDMSSLTSWCNCSSTEELADDAASVDESVAPDESLDA